MNAELRRNLWLEVTPHRLWLIPAVLCGLAALNWPPANTLALAALVVFTMVWGPRQAADAVIEEARERTWDIQRMSAQSPWALTWGKLFGATVMSWYGAGWCVLILFASTPPGTLAEQAATVGIVLGCALIAQGAAMMTALVGMHLERKAKARLSNAVAVALLVGLMWKQYDLFDAGARVAWYGIDLPRLDFTLAAVLGFAVWAILGAARAMCIELKSRTLPWAWLGFIGFTTLLAVGLQFPAGGPLASLLPRLLATGALVAGVLTYVGAFAFARDPVEYRRVLHAAAGGAWRRALEDLPVWVVSAALCLLLAAGTLLVGTRSHIVNTRFDNIGPGALALGLMMLRDIALLHGFSFRPDQRRAVATTLVYIAVLDLLLPLLAVQLDLPAAVSLFRPDVLTSPWLAIGVFAVHAALAFAFAAAMWRQRMRTQPSS